MTEYHEHLRKGQYTYVWKMQSPYIGCQWWFAYIGRIGGEMMGPFDTEAELLAALDKRMERRKDPRKDRRRNPQ